MKKIILFAISLFLCIYSNSQICNTDSLKTIITKASDTDPNISPELKRHYSYFNPTCISKNTLLLHLGGSFGKPGNYLLFPELAGNNGFNVINLHYPNTTASKTACGMSTDTNCFIKFRNEILEGIDYSTTVSVDSSNCIYNRVIKLLKYLHTNHPTQNWNSFYTGNTVNWNKVIVSGHSQGGGHAAVIGLTKQVKRVIMFASPNDYNNNLSMPAPWTLSTKTTPDSSYFGFAHLNDDVVNSSEQFQIWNNLNMPLFGDTTNVDMASSPYSNSRQLYTNYQDTAASLHSIMILDKDMPFVDGKPIFEPVWKYLLGIDKLVSVTEIQNKLTVTLFPNPTSNTLFIKSDKPIKQLTVHSISGKVILNQYNANSLDIRELKPGVYILTIKTEKGKSIKKFIKN